MSPSGNGENPLPLGEAFKVDDQLLPAEAGGLRKDEAKIRDQSLAAVERQGIAMFVMRWRGAALDVATNCVSVHGTYIALQPSLDGKEPTASKAVVLSYRSGLYCDRNSLAREI